MINRPLSQSEQRLCCVRGGRRSSDRDAESSEAESVLSPHHHHQTIPVFQHMADELLPAEALLEEFRLYYRRLHTAVTALSDGQHDSVVLSRLGDQLDIYMQLIQEVSQQFPLESYIICRG